MARSRTGRLRIYLGAAAGVGKTHAMLGDARLARDEGADVVLGYLEPHGRVRTEEQADTLERAPVVDLTGRRADLGVDVDWIVLRSPSVVLVDELAHTNVAGSPRAKRHEDVEVLLAAGIDVWTTVNVQHLESLRERVRELVGVEVRETFPDRLLHEADEVRLIDISPQALRERIARGFVYDSERIDAALSGFFTVRNVTALRALALHELAENAARQLAALDGADNAASPVERVVAAVGGRADTVERLVRAASRLARRTSAELVVVYVRRSSSARDRATEEAVARAGRLAHSLGAAFVQRTSDDPASAILEEVRAQHATLLVVGASDRSRLRAAVSPSPIDAIMRSAAGVDLYVVSRPARSGEGATP